MSKKTSLILATSVLSTALLSQLTQTMSENPNNMFIGGFIENSRGITNTLEFVAVDKETLTPKNDTCPSDEWTKNFELWKENENPNNMFVGGFIENSSGITDTLEFVAVDKETLTPKNDTCPSDEWTKNFELWKENELSHNNSKKSMCNTN